MNTTGDGTHSTGLESSLEMAYSYRRGGLCHRYTDVGVISSERPHDNTPPPIHTQLLFSLPHLGVTVDETNDQAEALVSGL